MQTRTLRHDQGGDPPLRQPVLVGRGARRDLVVELAGVMVVGRVAPAHVVLGDEGVSRRHVEIHADQHPPQLRDLGSKNGTRVNGHDVGEHPLRSGDLIELGQARLEFRMVSPAELGQARRTAQAWAKLGELSPRELEVARLVAAGAKSADIARQLHITTRTVNTHLEHVYDRLEIRSRTVLARLVIEARLDDEDE